MDIDDFPLALSDSAGEYAVEAANNFGLLGIGAALGIRVHGKVLVVETCATTDPVLMSAVCEGIITSTNAVSVPLAIAGVALFGASVVAKAGSGDD